MERIIQLMNNFEKRNNISITLTLYSDGSTAISEFWSDEILNESETTKKLCDFLMNTQYKCDENGRCISPVQIIE